MQLIARHVDSVTVGEVADGLAVAAGGTAVGAAAVRVDGD
jgi:hypothetical protein